MRLTSPKSQRVKWQEHQITQEKNRIKDELEAMQATGGQKRRLQLAQQRIVECEDQPGPLAQLRRFIYIVSSLVHHERHGGLTPVQVRKATNLATTILQTNGIQPGSSRLSFLYGELHLVVSQIYRKEGRQWHAAWEQQMAIYNARSALPGGKAFQSLSMANRTLRLGHATLAIREYQAAEAGPLAKAALEKARLGRIKANRLAGRWPEAARLIDELQVTQDLSPGALQELAWERVCSEVSQSQNPAAMIAAVRRGSTHHQAIYLLEAGLWVKGIQSRDWLDKLPSVGTMARRADLKPQRLGYFYNIATTLERCADLDVPLPIRVRDLGEALAETDLLTTIDKVLLTWVAAARFLARSSSFSLATLALSEYVAISLRLSQGASKDVLGIASDMIERPWFEQAADEQADGQAEDLGIAG